MTRLVWFTILNGALLLVGTALTSYNIGRHDGREAGLATGFVDGYRKGSCVTTHEILAGLTGLAEVPPMKPCTEKEWEIPTEGREQ